MSAPEKPVRSPCISICALNDEDICEGCYRSVEEITRWTRLNNDERRAVLARAGERAKVLNPFL